MGDKPKFLAQHRLIKPRTEPTGRLDPAQRNKTISESKRITSHESYPTRSPSFLQSSSCFDKKKSEMSISAVFGARVPVAPSPPTGSASSRAAPRIAGGESVGGGGMVSIIECSSRPKKKATAHHMKTRPRKTQAWDIRRKPTVYAPLPPLPPEWTLASSGGGDDADAASGTASSAGLSSPVGAPPTS